MSTPYPIEYMILGHSTNDTFAWLDQVSWMLLIKSRKPYQCIPLSSPTLNFFMIILCAVHLVCYESDDSNCYHELVYKLIATRLNCALLSLLPTFRIIHVFYFTAFYNLFSLPPISCLISCSISMQSESK